MGRPQIRAFGLRDYVITDPVAMPLRGMTLGKKEVVVMHLRQSSQCRGRAYPRGERPTPRSARGQPHAAPASLRSIR